MLIDYLYYEIRMYIIQVTGWLVSSFRTICGQLVFVCLQTDHLISTFPSLAAVVSPGVQ